MVKQISNKIFRKWVQMAQRGKVIHKAIILDTTLEKIIATTMEDFDQEDCMELDNNIIKKSQES